MSTKPKVIDLTMSDWQNNPGRRSAVIPKHFAVLLIAGAQLMIVLDITIVNVALPSIAKALRFDPTSLAWVVDAYTLVFGGLLLLGGRSGDIFGRRRMFLVGIIIFAGASFLGGLATSRGLLIAARAIQGVGGAIASPTALALIASNFPEGSERNEALGIFATVSAIGASLGLIFGALLTQYLNWRWVFFVNTPIAVLIAILTPRYLRESDKTKVGADILGSISSVGMIGFLVYGLIHSAATGWTSQLSVISFAGSALFLVVFLIREKSYKTPLLDLSIFANRNRSGAYAVMFLVAAALFSLWFFLTQYLQIVLKYSPIKAGFAFLPMTGTVMILAKIGSNYVKKFGPAPYLIYGPLAVGTALFLLGNLNAHSGYITYILPILLLNGTGLAATFAAVFPTALNNVTQKQAGLGSALVSVAQQVGGTLGISILVTVSTSIIRTNEVNFHHVKKLTTLANIAISSEIDGWTGGFKVGALMATLAGIIAALSIRRPLPTA